MPVRSPVELPSGCCSPFGNGLSSTVIGASLDGSDWFIDVVRVNPTWPWLLFEKFHGA